MIETHNVRKKTKPRLSWRERLKRKAPGHMVPKYARQKHGTIARLTKQHDCNVQHLTEPDRVSVTADN